MTKSKLTVRSETSRLVKSLMDNPQLPAYVRTLPPVSLIRVIDYLGKEDAQALLVHVSAEQLNAIIESDTWRSEKPGTQEKFSPESFLEWLELWSNESSHELTRRLKELGSELFARTLQKYVVVVDSYEVGVRGWTDRFGRFVVMPREEEQDEWPLLLQYMTDTWDIDPDFLEEVLAHVCMRRSLTIEKTYIADNESLAFDVEAARDRHRRDRGHVTAESASAFLRRIRQASIDELIVEGNYDAYSAIQLRRTAAGITEQGGKSATSAPFENGSATDSTSAVRLEKELAMNPGFVELQQLLGPIMDDIDGILQLTASSGDESVWSLETALQQLAIDAPVIASARLAELGYLSNVLMEGTNLSGNRLSQKDAMSGALQTANLGLLYCLKVDAWDDSDRVLDELLRAAPGLIKAFNVGYYLLTDLVEKAQTAMAHAFTDGRIRRRLSTDPWVANLVNKAMQRYQVHCAADRSRYQSLTTMLDNLGILFNVTTCARLSIISDDLPRFPLSLESNRSPGVHVDRRWRFISSPDDLNVLAEFIWNLPDELMQ